MKVRAYFVWNVHPEIWGKMIHFWLIRPIKTVVGNWKKSPQHLLWKNQMIIQKRIQDWTNQYFYFGALPKHWFDNQWMKAYFIGVPLIKMDTVIMATHLPSLKLTANAPENGPKANRKGSYSNHPFLGAFAVSFREGSSPGFHQTFQVPKMEVLYLIRLF